MKKIQGVTNNEIPDLTAQKNTSYIIRTWDQLYYLSIELIFISDRGL